MKLTTKLTKAQKLKVIEGFNFEIKTGQGQYKFRNGTYIMEGSDTARRLSLVHSFVNGTPLALKEATLADFDRVVAIQEAGDAYMQAGFDINYAPAEKKAEMKEAQKIAAHKAFALYAK